MGVLIGCLIVFGTALGAFASYFFKGVSDGLSGFDLGVIGALAKNRRFMLGVLLYLAAAANNVLLLRYVDYSVLLPLSSITYIWTMVIAHKLLFERITKRKIFGVVAIIVGALLLAHG